MGTRLASISGLLLTSAILITGCNSSSSSDTPTQANSTWVTITSSNAPFIASTVLDDSAAAKTYADLNPYASKPATTLGNPDATYISIFDLALSNTLTALNSSNTTLPQTRTAIWTNTLNCNVSGTKSISSTGGNPGDFFTLTFNQCKDSETSLTNGSYSFTLKSKTGDPSVANQSWSIGVSFTIDMTISDTSSCSSTVKGGATLTSGYDQTSTITSDSMKGNSLQRSWSCNFSDGSVQDGFSKATNFNFAHTEQASNGSYTTDIHYIMYHSNIDGLGHDGSVIVNTDPPFSGLYTNPPTEGTMVISGANGSSLTLVNYGSTFTITADGQTTTDAWAVLY